MNKDKIKDLEKDEEIERVINIMEYQILFLLTQGINN
jgi:hypothetical protein